MQRMKLILFNQHSLFDLVGVEIILSFISGRRHHNDSGKVNFYVWIFSLNLKETTFVFGQGRETHFW